MNGNPFYVDPMGGYGQSIVQGLSGLGAVLGDRQRAKREKEEQAAIQQEAIEVFNSGDPAKIAEFSLRRPEYAQQVASAIKFKNESTQQNMKDSMARILAGEDPQQVILERAQMVQEQGGDPIDTMNELAIYQQDPEGYLSQVERSYALLDPQGYTAFKKATATPEGEKLTGNMANIALARFGTADVSRLTPQQRADVSREAQISGSAGSTPAKIAEWQKFQELRESDPEGAIAFGQAAGFVNKEGKLSSFLEKRLSEATDQAFKSGANVAQYNVLADQIEKAGFSGGLFGGSWKEKIKDITGQQDADTELRRKFNAIKASQVVNNLPPGAASDKDIEMAMSGFPTDNYGAQELASFLRGLSKLEAINAEYNEFKANYITDTKSERGLLKAWKESKSGAEESESTSEYTDAEIRQAAAQAGVSIEEFKKALGL